MQDFRLNRRHSYGLHVKYEVTFQKIYSSILGQISVTGYLKADISIYQDWKVISLYEH